MFNYFVSHPLCTHANYPITVPNKKRNLSDQKVNSRIQQQVIKELTIYSIAPGLLFQFINNKN
jgi:hypothetical protein